MKSARTIRTLKRCGINPNLVGFAGASAPSGKSIRRMERKDHHKHLAATGDEYMTMHSLPRMQSSKRGFRAVQWEDDHA